MKIYEDKNCLVVDDDVEVYTCEETGKVLNLFSRTGAEIDSDEIEEEIFDYRQAQSELFCFGNIKWTQTKKEWTL